MESILENLQSITLIFNFIGTIVIIISLWYLAKQTQLTNKIAAGESEREVFDSFNDIVHKYSDTESVELLQRAFADYGALSNIEKARFNMIYLIPHVNNLEQCYRLNQLKMMAEVRVERIANLILAMVRTPGGQEAWQTLKLAYNPELVAYIEKIGATSQVPPMNQLFDWFQVEEK